MVVGGAAVPGDPGGRRQTVRGSVLPGCGASRSSGASCWAACALWAAAPDPLDLVGGRAARGGDAGLADVDGRPAVSAGAGVRLPGRSLSACTRGWMRHLVQQDHLLQAKHAYLNAPFFAVRAVALLRPVDCLCAVFRSRHPPAGHGRGGVERPWPCGSGRCRSCRSSRSP